MKLRDYQIDISDRGCDILKEYKILCLAAEVRSGKTLISLETARKYGSSHILFVTKLKAIPSIQDDYKSLEPGFNLTCINYESLHKIEDFTFDFIVVDEVHKCGAYPKAGKQQKELKKIIGSKPCILMSGTFTPESFSQIYHILNVSSNSPFNGYVNFYRWAKDYVTLQHKFLYGRQINDYSNANKEMIDEKTKHLFISLTQVEAGFNQVVTDEVHTVEMKESTYKLAKLLKKDRVIKGNSGVLLADTEVKLMTKIHQIFSGTVKLECGKTIILDKTKAEYIDNKFKGLKIAILYKFIEEGSLLRDYFKNNTSDPHYFNQTGNYTVFIGQIQSFREGVNLSSADYLIMYNIDFSSVSYFQARARMQHKDRIKPAIVCWIFAKRSIDFYIYEMVKKKKNFTLSHFKNSEIC